MYSPAQQPTLYFIGVTTAQSSIMKVFPAWAEYLGLDNALIRGMDFALHDDPQRYREAVAFIRDDPHSMGALVTTHKLDLFEACKDMFDEIDPHATLMSEVSCISKRDGKLIAHAKDPISSGLAIDGFLAPNHFANTAGHLLSMGAGGSTIAITWHAIKAMAANNRPAQIIVSNRSQKRLDHIKAIHEEMGIDIPVSYCLAPTPGDNDRIAAALPSGSLIINATGLGKDAPGSPFTDAVQLPEAAVVWELNYRGDLVFLDQANGQKEAKGLQVENGWSYFLHGWTQVIAEVFDVAIPTSGPQFDELSNIAKKASGRAS
ncbi:shikimate dehydrogenase family protein [Polycladidibacter stylochi]|uniref:shikimate dehydrogenase family protein n=1 Tax=Polycladidibacter stylochi TaxID=1807766 RepID=UPI0008335BF9|nr:shikimate dehydrogenase [Pseudovibrio stylochi]